MPEELSEEMINEIRKYVTIYNSKIDAANKFRLSYDTICFYTKDIRINRRITRKSTIKEKSPVKPYIKTYKRCRSIKGKSLDLLEELVQNGYAFSSGKYGLNEYIKLKNIFPKIQRIKTHRKMIYFLDDKSKLAAKALLEATNKKVISYQELKQIERVFDAKLKEK